MPVLREYTCFQGPGETEVIWNSDDLGGDFVIVRQNGFDLSQGVNLSRKLVL